MGVADARSSLLLTTSSVVAQVVAPGAIGGVETVVAELLRAARERGVSMRCLALLPPNDPLPLSLQELEATGVRVVRVPAAHRQYRQQYRALRDALRECGAQVVHSHGYHADVLSGFAARSLGVPHVATLHGFVGSNARGRLYEWLQLRTLRRAFAVIAVSQPIAERTVGSGVTASRVHVIQNAAPHAEPLPQSEARAALALPLRGPVIGWVGRLSAEKAPARFVALVDALQREPPVVGVILGDGPHMASIREASETLRASGRMLLPGAVAGAGRLLSAFDVLVLTSDTEGTPMVILEAMRAGVPVVSTAVGGVPAMLADGAGLLVPVGDLMAMQRAVERLLDDQTLANQVRRTAADRASATYGGDAWWERHAALYGAAGCSLPTTKR